MESHIRGLSSLEKSYGDLLVPIVVNKLTTELRRNLAREHSNTQWILSDIMAALQKEIRVLESGLHSPYNPVADTSTTSTFQVSTKDNRDHSTTCANTGKKNGPVCVFCKGL